MSKPHSAYKAFPAKFEMFGRMVKLNASENLLTENQIKNKINQKFIRRQAFKKMRSSGYRMIGQEWSFHKHEPDLPIAAFGVAALKLRGLFVKANNWKNPTILSRRQDAAIGPIDFIPHAREGQMSAN